MFDLELHITGSWKKSKLDNSTFCIQNIKGQLNYQTL